MFEASTPDGKPWVSYKLRTDEVGNDELVTIKGPDLDENELEKKAITQTGLFPFKITLKNALAGTNTALFEGKFKVATYAPDQAIPEYKGKQEFYVVQDWRLPIGFIYDPTLDRGPGDQRADVVPRHGSGGRWKVCCSTGPADRFGQSR
jgi:hypothetical protein